MVFYLFIGFIIFQRLSELVIARSNEQKLKAMGAIEAGQGHYKAMVLIHIAFLLSTVAEVVFMGRDLSAFWPLLISLFLATQVMRVWALMSLGPFWNTKIIILPGAEAVKKGPYKLLKHPNYAVVTAEIMIIPLMFEAYFTALFFTVINIIILSIRIHAEEKALKEWTTYGETFKEKNRFLPNLLNKFDNR
nr:isoprenylcysteine carboxylmethyltransferase family protein [Bacillus mediterraneensis]